MNKKTINQNPEQRARDRIDRQLVQAGWVVQDKNTIDFSAGRGIAERESHKATAKRGRRLVHQESST